ncbi:hypothetical protein [Sphingomonas phage Birtae]|nr:hypothetical protein [Sphingomonas phage Birtae]
MATLRKSGGRKPIATGKVSTSYGMRLDINEGARGVSLSMHGDNDDRSYTLSLTDEELDRIVAYRNSCKPEFDAQDAERKRRMGEHGVPA